MYKLRSWIDESQLKYALSENPNAVEYLEEHPDKIDYNVIGRNPNAIHIIEKKLYQCPTYDLLNNPNMTNLLRNNRTLIQLGDIFRYAHNIEFVEELIKNNELEKINWVLLSCNHAAIHILEQYPEKINWYTILWNKNALHIIRNNLEKVEKHWGRICEQPHLISLIELYPEKINWCHLTKNYNAIHLLKNNLDKIDIDDLRSNKNGFELLLHAGHRFNDNLYYDENIVYSYWNYCKTHNLYFTLPFHMSKHGYTDEHFEFIKKYNNYFVLSKNPNIFIYDYSRMKKTRQEQPWYQEIKNEFI